MASSTNLGTQFHCRHHHQNHKFHHGSCSSLWAHLQFQAHNSMANMAVHCNSCSSTTHPVTLGTNPCHREQLLSTQSNLGISSSSIHTTAMAIFEITTTGLSPTWCRRTTNYPAVILFFTASASPAKPSRHCPHQLQALSELKPNHGLQSVTIITTFTERPVSLSCQNSWMCSFAGNALWTNLIFLWNMIIWDIEIPFFQPI